MRLKVIKYLDLVVEYAIYALIFYIPISIALVSIFSYMAVILFWIKQLLSPDFSKVGSNKTFFLILFTFFLFMALSVMNSGPLMAKSLNALFMKWGRFVLILWVIVDTFRDSKRIGKASYVLFFGAALVGLSVVSQKFFGFEFLRHRPLDSVGFITGPFISRIDLASYFSCVIPFVLSFSLWKWKLLTVKVWLLLITLMLMLLSLCTYCRGGWIGLTAGMITIPFLINYNCLSKKLFWILLSAVYIFILPSIAISLFFIKDDPQRVVLYRGAWKMIVEHPFLGKGLGTFMDYCVQYTNNYWPCYAHNCFLQIWAESGIFSLLSFLALNGYVLYKAIKVILRMPVTLNFYILIGLTSGYLGFLVHCFFDTQLYSFQLSFLFWVVLGLTVALTDSEGKTCLLNS